MQEHILGLYLEKQVKNSKKSLKKIIMNAGLEPGVTKRFADFQVWGLQQR